MRKFFHIFLLSWLIVFSLAQVVTAAPASSFSDLAGHWAEREIEELAAMGVVRGDPTGRVRPDEPITRAEFLALLLRAEDLEPDPATVAAGSCPFADVSSDRWYYAYVWQGWKKGIVKGTGGNLFGPEQLIRREELTAMMLRASDGIAVTGSETPPFQDVPADRWSYPYVRTAWQAGIVRGKTATGFAPTEQATRAQAMVFIRRLLEAETNAATLPADDQLIQLVEGFSQQIRATLNAGYPYNWSEVQAALVGRARDAFEAFRQYYDLRGASGEKLELGPLDIKNSVIKKREHLAVLNSEVVFDLTATGPAGKTTTTSTLRYTFFLRRQNQQWKIFDFSQQ